MRDASPPKTQHFLSGGFLYCLHKMGRFISYIREPLSLPVLLDLSISVALCFILDYLHISSATSHSRSG